LTLLCLRYLCCILDRVLLARRPHLSHYLTSFIDNLTNCLRITLSMYGCVLRKFLIVYFLTILINIGTVDKLLSWITCSSSVNISLIGSIDHLLVNTVYSRCTFMDNAPINSCLRIINTLKRCLLSTAFFKLVVE